MKLKEIKPGMVIHCNSQEEYERLNEETQRLGLKGLPTSFSQDIVYVIHEYVVLWNYAKNCNYTEFSDLIVQEMSADEAFSIYKDICKHYFSCEECPLSNPAYTNCGMFIRDNSEKAIDIMGKWKSDHEKKDPEIEWFWKSYAVGGSDYKEADTEQEAMEWCEYYVKEHPEAKCIYKRVCRVKEVE